VLAAAARIPWAAQLVEGLAIDGRAAAGLGQHEESRQLLERAALLTEVHRLPTKSVSR